MTHPDPVVFASPSNVDQSSDLAFVLQRLAENVERQFEFDWRLVERAKRHSPTAWIDEIKKLAHVCEAIGTGLFGRNQATD